MLKLSSPVVIIGLGQTGLACLRFLTTNHIRVSVVDCRVHPPMLEIAKTEFPDAQIECGSFDTTTVKAAATIIVSPGVSVQHPAIKTAADNGAKIIGDVELFASVVSKPVIAISGSNGKTTVTHLVGELLRSVGLNIAVGGNIGTPCLQLLEDKAVDFFVLELSSFQLETTHSLNPICATVLNISPDHLDRYPNMDAYQEAKLSIFKANSIAIVPLQQDWQLASIKTVKTFAIADSLNNRADYSVAEFNQQKWVSVAGEPWMAISELQLFGKHNQLNVLAALALVKNAGVDIYAENKQCLISALKQFKGLPHRCEVVAKKQGVLWINDSKATNVASANAAIESFAEEFSGKIVLIAGGDSKQADLSTLKINLEAHVFALITIGKDGYKIAKLMSNQQQVLSVNDLQSAVNQAEKLVPVGGVVLLAPACSSLDMFSNYEARGNCFIEAVEALAA